MMMVLAEEFGGRADAPSGGADACVAVVSRGSDGTIARGDIICADPTPAIREPIRRRRIALCQSPDRPYFLAFGGLAGEFFGGAGAGVGKTEIVAHRTYASQGRATTRGLSATPELLDPSVPANRNRRDLHRRRNFSSTSLPKRVSRALIS
jgi:hypothetical protein